MGKLRIALLTVLLFGTAAWAETKVNGELYPQWHMDFSEGADHYNSFELTRTYVTVTSDINEQTDVRITVDLRSITGYNGYAIVVKYGYVNWQPKFTGNASFRFGLQQTQYLDVMSKIWGRRYLEKTITDLSGMMTTADLGASSTIKFGKSGTTAINLAIFNGTSFSNVRDLNKQKDLNAVLTLKPAAGSSDFKNSMILGQFYYGTQNIAFAGAQDPGDYRNSVFSIGGILDYASKFSVGLDANWKTIGQGVGNSDVDMSAISVFATYFLGQHTADGSFLDNCNLFGRMDFNDPNGSVPDNGTTYAILGLEYVTSANIKTSLNVRTISYEAPGVSTESFLYFNALLVL